jgi:hypothetical protein
MSLGKFAWTMYRSPKLVWVLRAVSSPNKLGSSNILAARNPNEPIVLANYSISGGHVGRRKHDHKECSWFICEICLENSRHSEEPEATEESPAPTRGELSRLPAVPAIGSGQAARNDVRYEKCCWTTDQQDRRGERRALPLSLAPFVILAQNGICSKVRAG